MIADIMPGVLAARRVMPSQHGLTHVRTERAAPFQRIMARGLLTGCLANPIFTRLANVKAWFSSMALYSVELLVEIEAPSAEEAAGLALLEARTTTDPLTVSVYSDEPATDRCWRQVVVDVRALEGLPRLDRGTGIIEPTQGERLYLYVASHWLLFCVI